MEICNVVKPYTRPVAYRDLPEGPDTCPYPPGVSPASPDVHEEVGSDSTQCQGSEELRNSRERALQVLDGLFLPSSSKADVDTFRGLLSELFDDDVNLTSIGLTKAQGRGQVEDFLLARMVGIFEWRGRERNDVIWLTPLHVSYSLRHGEFGRRFLFVSFKQCSNKIVDMYIVEHGVMSALGSQFYYADLKRDAFTEYDVTSSQFCENVTASCAELSPYTSEKECHDLYHRLKGEKRVLCNNFENDRVSMDALLGDTVSCRYHYLLMSRTNPEKFCPLLAVDRNGFCARSKCPESYYGDMFGDSGQQRFESSDGFACSVETGLCREQWSAQIDASPVN